MPASYRVESNPWWSATRRRAYDPSDSEEDEEISTTKLKLHGPTPESTTSPAQPAQPVQPVQNPARVSPRAPQTRKLADRRRKNNLPPELTLQPSQGILQSKTGKNPASSMGKSFMVGENSANTDKKSKDSDSEWIICEPSRSSKWYQGTHGKRVNVTNEGWRFRCNAPRNWTPRGRVKSKKPKTTFLTLPAEIRNAVYELVVPECRVLITRSCPNRELQWSKKFWSEEHVKRKRPRSRLMHELDVAQESDGYGTAVNLLLTCKAVRDEVETLLYSQTFFHFFSLKNLRKFLSTASKTGIESIRKASIKQDGYGNPQTTNDQEYQSRYYKRWEETCAKFGQMTPNLEHLKLAIYDREWPSVLSGGEYNPGWREAIMKTAPALLPKVEVRIYHQMIDRNREGLKDLARQIENGMMTSAGRCKRDRIETEQAMAQIAARKAAREERERKRQAKLNAAPPPTELTISMDEVQKRAKQNPKTVKVRRHGLDKFSKVNTSTMSVGELQQFQTTYCSQKHRH